MLKETEILKINQKVYRFQCNQNNAFWILPNQFTFSLVKIQANLKSAMLKMKRRS